MSRATRTTHVATLGIRAADHAEPCARGADVDAEVLRTGPGVPHMFAVRDPDGNDLIVVQTS
ncbi:hypothetical protein [Streptomyces rubrogriseus]|uniref:hypothetical protein n=1 Tax=Streptomyces rubrogriseus TaxID=194673 RepID=UPI0037D1DA60